MRVCYLVISPDPRRVVASNYSVKFGDGQAEAAYHRANPNYARVENNLAPDEKRHIRMYNEIEDTRWPGKWLEWIHIKITGGRQVRTDGHTEWHELQAKSPDSPQDRDELRNRLIAMLDLFGQWNRWDEMGDSDEPTARFENLVDDTWHCDREEAIARFID
ncbi:hypothetical protein EG329_008616 [Mollisiaceae sp. DMI_Dod_QoI]|nr:hypothetical protein EG329_008616 [Helotiales sp. DMI_Dod_QoI]